MRVLLTRQRALGGSSMSMNHSLASFVRLMWLRIKRVLICLTGMACASVGIAAVVRPIPEMPSTGFMVALYIAILALIGLGAWLIWLSLRGSDDDIKEIA